MFQYRETIDLSTPYLDDFGRHVIGCAAKTIGGFIQIYLQFTHAKIGDTHMSLIVQQDVVQFEIPVTETERNGMS